MTLHAFGRYLKHVLKAKSRHSIHSPFVFAFMEAVLRKDKRYPLRQRLEAYFGKENMVYAGTPADAADMLYMACSEKVIVVAGPHRTKQDTETWEALVSSEQVRLSLDLYDTGLLFFRPEFREQQHFLLRK